MDLASYSDLAIELVNTEGPGGDTLRDLAGLQALLIQWPLLGGRLGHRDLDTLRELRAEFRAIFVSARAGDEDDAIQRLNALLIRHPVHPLLSEHDGRRWHLHVNETGAIPDRYAARAAMGLAVAIGDQGLDRLGICAAAGCEDVFLDTTATRSRRFCSGGCAERTTAAAATRLLRDGVKIVPSPRGQDERARNAAARDGGQ